MKSLLVTFACIALLFSCNTSGPKQAPSDGETEVTWSLAEVWRTDTLLDEDSLLAAVLHPAEEERFGQVDVDFPCLI